MTRFAVIVMLMLVISPAYGQDDDPAMLKAENDMLRASVKRQQEIIAELKAENARLKAKLGPSEPTDKPQTDTSGNVDAPVYRGQKRSKFWFETAYNHFRDKIALVDGKYVDIGKDLLTLGKVAGKEEIVSGNLLYLHRETLCEGFPRVLQVLGPSELLVNHPAISLWKGGAMYRSKASVIHIRGIDTKGLVDGRVLGDKTLLHVGTYQYQDLLGATRTVSSYVLCKPLTKEQFADALAKGFKLTEYKNERGKITERKIE
jgi:hypothetical protein